MQWTETAGMLLVISWAGEVPARALIGIVLFAREDGVDHQGPRGNFYEVRTIDVALPRLDPDSAATCPVPYEQVLEHVTTEFDDGSEKQLSEPTFLRTARVGGTSYWIWRFNDPSRGDGYILVSLWPPNRACIECDDTFDMTPEQFIVATYFKIEP